MKRVGPLSAFLIAALLGPAPVFAQLQNFVEICGDPNARPADVVNMCQRALATGDLPKTAEAQVRNNLGAALYDMKRYNEALDEYTAALNSEPAFVAAYLNRARVFEKLQRLREAVDDYAVVMEIDPKAADAFVGRGALLLSHGDPKRAVGDLNRAIELEPDWVSPYFNRGLAHLRLEDYGRAALDFSTVIKRNPTDAGAHLNRGRARAALGMANAVQDFNQAITLAPEWGGAWFARGRFLDQQGKVDAANSDFLRANELGYPDPWLHQRVREILG